jgi:hypothetical protein
VSRRENGGPQSDIAERAEALGERFGRALASVPRRLRGDGAQNAGATVTAEDGERFRRADVLVTRMQHAVAAYTTVVGQRLTRFAARLREEAEDIAAEAQHVRSRRPAAETSSVGVERTTHNGAA